MKPVTIVLLTVLAGLPATAQVVLYEGARLITGDGSPAIENSAVLVGDRTVTQIGKKGEIKPPPGTIRVDLNGKKLDRAAMRKAWVNP